MTLTDMENDKYTTPEKTTTNKQTKNEKKPHFFLDTLLFI